MVSARADSTRRAATAAGAAAADGGGSRSRSRHRVCVRDGGADVRETAGGGYRVVEQYVGAGFSRPATTFSRLNHEGHEDTKARSISPCLFLCGCWKCFHRSLATETQRRR